MLRTRRTSQALLLACLLSSAFASSSHAAAPATVTVRVEGLSQTLLAPTTVTTNDAPVEKDGNAEHTCSGASAAGALEQATSGRWSGAWFGGIGYSVETLLGETHAFEPGVPANYFWTYWLDNREASAGICEGQLSAGDSILFFPTCFSETGACPPAPSVLGVSAPQTAEAGVPFGVTVTSYSNASGTPSPAADATVSDGAVEARTDALGHATLALSATGSSLLRVTAPEAVRTEASVCVHSGFDGNCGTTPPAPGARSVAGPPPPPPYKGPYAVVARVASIREGEIFGRRRAPRLLTGTASAHTTLTSVSLRLRRSLRGRCFAYDGASERFARARCGAGSFFKVASGPTFSYLLPSKLARGRYVLDLQAADAAGNETSLARGSTRVVFFVR
jgi:hypothetical protein